MKLADVKALPLGLYRVQWKESQGGGFSIAAMGAGGNGDRWLAPCNWLAPSTDGKVWRSIERLDLLLAYGGDAGTGRVFLGQAEQDQRSTSWSQAVPKVDGFYWLRRSGKEDTIVKLWDTANGRGNSGAMVSWVGSDWDSPLGDALKRWHCSWAGPLIG